jgi:hypothetical protein
MPGERWPDKRARAVLFAGANKLAKDDLAVDPDAVADLGLAVRERLFADDEVREETADAKAHRIGYNADCMQYAILGPATDGVLLSLWVGPDAAPEAKQALGATDDPNPFRRLYGWVQCTVTPAADLDHVAEWVARARRHSAAVKAQQAQTAM